MGTTLTGTTPQDTYDSLIKVTDNGPLSGTAKYLSDGLGNDSTLALSTGNVGIGTTSLAARLHVFGNVGDMLRLDRDNTGAVGNQIAFRHSNAGTLTETATINVVSTANADTGSLVLSTKPTGGSVTERMRITSAGNVGIGTNNPQGRLHVSSTGDTYFVLTGGATPLSYSFLVDANDLRLFTGVGSSEKLRVTSSYLRMASGTGGIQFNGDTAAANALDDYEEGTWTMGLSFGGGTTGITYILRSGYYTKIGRQVTVNGLVALSNKGSSTGTALLTGLPFTIANVQGNYGGASLYLYNVSFANQFQGHGSINATTVDLREITEAGVVSNLTDANFQNNSEIIISLTYFV